MLTKCWCEPCRDFTTQVWKILTITFYGNHALLAGWKINFDCMRSLSLFHLRRAFLSFNSLRCAKIHNKSKINTNLYGSNQSVIMISPWNRCSKFWTRCRLHAQLSRRLAQPALALSLLLSWSCPSLPSSSCWRAGARSSRKGISLLHYAFSMIVHFRKFWRNLRSVTTHAPHIFAGLPRWLISLCSLDKAGRPLLAAVNSSTRGNPLVYRVSIMTQILPLRIFRFSAIFVNRALTLSPLTRSYADWIVSFPLIMLLLGIVANADSASIGAGMGAVGASIMSLLDSALG